MKITEDLLQFIQYSERFIGTKLLLTDMEKSIVEINFEQELDFSERKITEQLKNLKIKDVVIRNEGKAFPLLENHGYEVNAEMILPVRYKGKQIGFLVYHDSRGEFEEAHKEYGKTGRYFVERLIAKHYNEE